MSVYQSAPTLEQAAITAKDFNFWYGDFHALTGLDLNIAKNAITSFIGPSGCGKSTFLRCINRMNDLIEGTRVEGTMTLDGNDIYAEGVDPVDLRRRVGMIFQQPNPFPKSIYENVAFYYAILCDYIPVCNHQPAFSHAYPLSHKSNLFIRISTLPPHTIPISPASVSSSCTRALPGS